MPGKVHCSIKAGTFTYRAENLFTLILNLVQPDAYLFHSHLKEIIHVNEMQLLLHIYLLI